MYMHVYIHVPYIVLQYSLESGASVILSVEVVCPSLTLTHTDAVTLFSLKVYDVSANPTVTAVERTKHSNFCSIH